METTLTYQKAFEELQEITKAIESEEVSVDDLAKKVKRAAELLEICNARLKATEEEVNKIIERISS
ncbi:exodeoxyribonuclease VII small subunit [Chryseobacterium sp.]|jgi:exodeoxyribonuclease VII small subunit|uniref:exodeoxyribonuclease VII small subunit n=1 Tax=Chryseobacterium sp. TaxID=1871047 RepID=UPI0011C7B0C0|nr:exodeoxyribonuclease VII small subunit [Chryseobacterium sp.]TXF77781.1 exodeoxyribonuclease VII small subunit [Chryseobacterium sp.]